MPANRRSIPDALTAQDRQRLTELCRIFTNGGNILPSEWNVAGAKVLEEGIQEMCKCSRQFSTIKLFFDNFPKGKPDWRWIITTAYSFLTTELDPKKSGEINAICQRYGSQILLDNIQYAIAWGEK